MRCVLTVLGLLLLAACGTAEPAQPQLTPAQMDDQFWTAYEQRLGMVGKDYADPAAAKRGSIRYGHIICEELDKGADRGVVQSKLTNRDTTADEARVQVDTAAEFLCPQHATE